MRILHVLPSLDQMYGGPISAVLELSARGFEFGLTSEVLGFGDKRLFDCPLAADRIHELPHNRPYSYCYSRDLRAWLRARVASYGGVVLHGMWLYPNWAAAEECTALSVPYACFPHGMLEPWPVRGQGLLKRAKKTAYWHLREREIFHGAKSVFFTTKRERSLAGETFKIPNRQRLIIPYGVTDMVERAEHPANPALEAPAGARIALFLGRVHPKKNVHFLIDTWMKARIGDEWRLIIAGPGDPDYLKSLQGMVSSGAAGKRVEFVGAVRGVDKAYLFQRADWFVLPSKQENFGVAVLEAINNGCPVVISDQVYLADELHESSEILPLSQEAWIRFMEERMPDAAWRARVLDLDTKLVRPKFSVQNVARSWVSTLNEVFSS